MKIRMTDTVKEGREVFHNGDERTVSEELGTRFVKNGWAIDLAGNIEPGSTTGGTLEVQDLTIQPKGRAK